MNTWHNNIIIVFTNYKSLQTSWYSLTCMSWFFVSCIHKSVIIFIHKFAPNSENGFIVHLCMSVICNVILDTVSVCNGERYSQNNIMTSGFTARVVKNVFTDTIIVHTYNHMQHIINLFTKRYVYIMLSVSCVKFVHNSGNCSQKFTMI